MFSHTTAGCFCPQWGCGRLEVNILWIFRRALRCGGRVRSETKNKKNATRNLYHSVPQHKDRLYNNMGMKNGRCIHRQSGNTPRACKDEFRVLHVRISSCCFFRIQYRSGERFIVYILVLKYLVMVFRIFLQSNHLCATTDSAIGALNPFSTAAPIRGQTSLIPSDLSPKRDWGPKKG